jgi:hypothetical protein
VSNIVLGKNKLLSANHYYQLTGTRLQSHPL